MDSNGPKFFDNLNPRLFASPHDMFAAHLASTMDSPPGNRFQQSSSQNQPLNSTPMPSSPPEYPTAAAQDTTDTPADDMNPTTPISANPPKTSDTAANNASADTVFMDPLTGRPSSPPDLVGLAFITRAHPGFAFKSIPGIIYFISIHLDRATSTAKNQLPTSIPFRLKCTHVQDNYTRLYTQWLFSGSAPTWLVRLHNTPDGISSVSFHGRMRVAIYLCRLYSCREENMSNIKSHLSRLFKAPACPNLSDERWFDIVLRTEPTEVFNRLWCHLMPSMPSTDETAGAPPEQPQRVISLEPFRGSASLAPKIPKDMTEGWYLWTPITSPEFQAHARKVSRKIGELQERTFIDPATLAPQTERSANFLRRQNGVDTDGPDTVGGASQVDIPPTAPQANSSSAQEPNQFTAWINSSLPTIPEPIDPDDLQLDPPTINPLAPQYKPIPGPPTKGRPPIIRTTTPIPRPGLNLPPRPPTPPTPIATTFFEEAMDSDPYFDMDDLDYPIRQSPTSEREDFIRDNMHLKTREAAHQQLKKQATTEVVRAVLEKSQRNWDREQKRYEESGKRGKEKVYGVPACAAENVGFVEKDWDLGGVMNPQ